MANDQTIQDNPELFAKLRALESRLTVIRDNSVPDGEIEYRSKISDDAVVRFKVAEMERVLTETDKAKARIEREHLLEERAAL